MRASSVQVRKHVMSTHGNEPGGIHARRVEAENVVFGVQTQGGTAQSASAVQHIHMSGQKYTPPLQLPRRAEHFQDRASERAWLLANLHPGRIVTLCGPGGMG